MVVPSFNHHQKIINIRKLKLSFGIPYVWAVSILSLQVTPHCWEYQKQDILQEVQPATKRLPPILLMT